MHSLACKRDSIVVMLQALDSCDMVCEGAGTLLHMFLFMHAKETCFAVTVLQALLSRSKSVPCLQAIHHKQVEGYLQRAFKDRLQACFFLHETVLPVSVLLYLRMPASAFQQHCKQQG